MHSSYATSGNARETSYKFSRFVFNKTNSQLTVVRDLLSAEENKQLTDNFGDGGLSDNFPILDHEGIVV